MVDPVRTRATSEALCPWSGGRRDDGRRVRYDAGAALAGPSCSIVDYGVDAEIDNSRTTVTCSSSNPAPQRRREWAAGGSSVPCTEQLLDASNCSLPQAVVSK